MLTFGLVFPVGTLLSLTLFRPLLPRTVREMRSLLTSVMSFGTPTISALQLIFKGEPGVITSVVVNLDGLVMASCSEEQEKNSN